MAQNIETNNELFDRLKKSLLNIDVVEFCKDKLNVDGKPLDLSSNGFRPFSDIYRYIAIKALEPNAKPMILVKSRQVGGTTMAAALEMYFMGSGLFGANGKASVRIMHLFPQLEHAGSYSKTKLNQMISSSSPIKEITDKKTMKPKAYMESLLDKSTDSNNSLSFKQFINGNYLWVESIGMTGDRIMGRTSDIIFFDEIQSMSSQAIGSATKILTTAKYGKVGKGVQIYFGTPRKRGTDYHKMWNASSQQYYYLGCEKCKQHFPLYTPESDEWEKIWLYDFIVKCTHCGHEQDKRPAADRGKWVALKDVNDESCLYVGFHINKLYMPTFTKEDIISDKPGVHPTNSERLYQTEILGEFYSGEAALITSEEIIELCGDHERKFSKIIHPSQDQMIVMGIDYGARADAEQLLDSDKANNNGKSFTTAVILSVKGPGLLSIERAIKFKKNDVESKKGIIAQLMREYSINLCIGDIGFSNDFSQMLNIEYGDKYLVSRASGSLNNHIKYRTDSMPKEIQFERDYYIREMFEQLKMGKIRFPLGSYEQVAWLIDHCSSMDIKPSISRNGEATIHYVKGGSPNDGFMALLNAYIAYKFLITNGFKINNPLLIDQKFKLKNQIMAVGANVKM